jgi:solute carrier family 50 protein (sugar transporter)
MTNNASISKIILEYVCPSLGMIAANIMFAAPLKDCHRAVVQGRLGSLNPTPWAFMLGNTFGWVTYGILKDRNLFIFFANAPGFLMSVWLNLQATKLQYAESRNRQLQNELDAFVNRFDDAESTVRTKNLPNETDREEAVATTTTISHRSSSEAEAATPSSPHEKCVIFMVVIWTMLICIICFAELSNGMNLNIIGTADNINLVFFYGAPLSTIYTVMKSRSAETIHVPTMLTNTANGSFWAAYGIAVLDPFIAVPNALGALLGLIQIILCLLFPRNTTLKTTTTTSNQEEVKNNHNHHHVSSHCHATAELAEEEDTTGSISLAAPLEK